MAELGIPEADGGVCFGQLLGMCDHVSLALGMTARVCTCVRHRPGVCAPPMC